LLQETVEVKSSKSFKNNKKHLKNKKKRREQTKKSRKRAILRNKKYVEAYKIQHPCPCGETEPCCLSFHHKNEDKVGNISDMSNKGYSIKRIQKEIDKCDILCLNCHTKLHNQERIEDVTII